jgi:hypothetical protein
MVVARLGKLWKMLRIIKTLHLKNENKRTCLILIKKILFIQECLKMENAALENMSVIRRIFPISGAGNRHNITSVNVIASLHSSLKPED